MITRSTLTLHALSHPPSPSSPHLPSSSPHLFSLHPLPSSSPHLLSQSRSPTTTKLARLIDFLQASACRRTPIMLVDAFDVFFNQPAPVALSHFHAAKAEIVFAVERKYSHQV